MPYDIAGALQYPNTIANGLAAGRQGMADGLAAKQRADQNKLADLSAQAYTAPADGRNALLSQMAAIDPDSAAKQSQAFATMDANQKAQLAAGLEQFAHTAASIAQDPDEQRSTAAYGQLIDQLAATGKDVSRFRSVPPKVGAQMALVQIASTKDLLAASGIGADQGVVVAPGGVLVNKASGAQMFRNPANMQYQNVPMGAGNAAGVFDPATGQVRPAVGMGGAPTADPMQAIIAQGNKMVAQGVPSPQVEAWMQQQAQSAGLNPQPAGADAGPVPAATGAPLAGNQPQTSQAAAQAPAQFGIGTPKTAADTPPSGYQWNADHSQLVAIPGGPADKTGASSVTLGDATKTGNEFLSSIPDPAMQNLIKSVAEGRMPLPKIYRAGKAGEIGPTQIAQAVAQYDPTYDQADPNSRIKARADFTSGKAALEIQRLNTLAGHLLGLADATDKLNNSGISTDYNAIANNIATRTGSKVVTNFNQAAQPAAEEFAAIMKGTGAPTEQEIQLQQKNLDSSLGPEQLHGVIGTMAAQVQSRLEALGERATNGLGPFAPKVTIVTPEGRKALDALRERGLIPSFHIGSDGTATQPAPQQPSAGGWSATRVN